MMAFNAAARETCIVRSDITTTPLQALTLLNNVTFVEAARCLAERMLSQADDPNHRIRWAFRLVTSREPHTDEVKLLTEDLVAFQEQFQNDVESARKLLATGETPFNQELHVPTIAAYTLVANTLLNLDEAMTQK